MIVWFASGNEYKRDELRAILGGYDIKIPADAGLEFAPDENAPDFAGNALIKAHALYRLVCAPVIADDSGLCVDALGGAPGVYSARYGSENGVKLGASERNALLLSQLGDSDKRSARFVCAMALMLDANRFFVAQETLEGEIARQERGSGGFGYDPILYLPDKGRTVAELDSLEKNLLSHRAKAARAVERVLRLDSVLLYRDLPGNEVAL
jgi:XTP/dITP diphosphohydrolase